MSVPSFRLLKMAAGLAFSCALAAAMAGCMALRWTSGNTAQGLVASIQRQTDLELVREGMPTFLLLLDGMVDSAPRDESIRLAAARAYLAYAAAFSGEDPPDRAPRLYAKARDHALSVLTVRKAFGGALTGTMEEFDSAVRALTAREVPAAYATAMAWFGLITSQPSSVEALGDLPKAVALVQRVHELAPSHDHGGPSMILGIYYAAQPTGAGRDLDRSRRLFDEARAAAGPDYLPPLVAFAESYARYAFDRALFEQTLREVIAHETANPEFNLANEAARQRARRLLSRADDFF